MSAWMCACESTWERTNEWVQKRFTSTARKRTITTATHRFSHGLSTHNDQTQHNTIQLWDRLRYFFSSFNNLNHFPRILFPFLHNPFCRSLTECCHPLKTTQTRKQTSQQQQQQQPKIIIYAYLLRLIMMHRNNEKVSHYITHTHTHVYSQKATKCKHNIDNRFGRALDQYNLQHWNGEIWKQPLFDCRRLINWAVPIDPKYLPLWIPFAH